MGKKAREIISADPDDVIRDLAKAYALEWAAHHLFYTYAQVVKGLDAHIFREQLVKQSQDELGHAGRIAQRIAVLGGHVPLTLEEISSICPIRPPQHAKNPTDYKGFMRDVIEIERAAISSYHDIMKKYRDSDHLTYELAEDLLGDELGEEEEWERALEGL